MSDAVPYSVPKEPGRWRALALAAAVHGALLAFLWIGVRWQNETPVSVEAEVWSPQPREAAPQPQPQPEPPPQPQPEPRPQPVQPAPPPPVVQPEPRPTQPDPEIVLEQEKKKREKEKREQEARAEQERLARQRAEEKREEERRAALQREREEEKRAEQRRLAEQERLEKEKAEKEAARKLAQAEAAKKAAAEKAAAEKAAAEKKAAEKLAAEKKRKQEAADAEMLAKIRDQEMRNITGKLAGTGGAGDAPKSQGSRADTSYTQRVGAKIKSNTIYDVPEDMASNPAVEYEVSLLPDGSLRGARKLRSSGIPGFDAAVLRAIEKSQPYPPDKSGTVPSGFILSHKPKDQ